MKTRFEILVASAFAMMFLATAFSGCIGGNKDAGDASGTDIISAAIAFPTDKINADSNLADVAVVEKYGDAYLATVSCGAYVGNESIYVAHFKGTHYEIGYQYGYLLNQRIVDSLNTAFASLVGDAGPALQPAAMAAYVAVAPYIPQEYKDELNGIVQGATDRGVSGLSVEYLGGLLGILDAVSCSFFAAWGNRSVDGKMYATRNLDFTAQSGLSNYKIIGVYEPEGENAYFTITYMGIIGVIIGGMNERGVAVSEIGSKNLANTIEGVPWTLRMREILGKANSAAEGVVLEENMKGTFGMRYMIADGCPDGLGKMQAFAIEEDSNFKGVFIDNDPKEDYATVQPSGECYALKLKEAVYRADASMDQRIRYTETADNGPGPFGDPRTGESYTNRYVRQYDMLAAFENGMEYVNPHDNQVWIKATGKKTLIGPEEAMTICRVVAMEDSDVASVVYGCTDLEFWVAFETGMGESWKFAPHNQYVHFKWSDLVGDTLVGRISGQSSGLISGGYASSQLYAGCAIADITAPIGTPMAGYGSPRPGQGIHDPIYAKVLVLDNGAERAAIVTTDLVGVTFDVRRDIANRIVEETGIAESNLLICSSHTHSAPGWHTENTVFPVVLGFGPAVWHDFVVGKISDAVIDAYKNKEPSSIGFGSAYEYDITMNRRYPGGLIDPEIGIIRVDDMNGNIKTVLVNFVAHATCLRQDNTLFSADWPGYMMKHLSSMIPGNPVVMYANGAEADVETKVLLRVSDITAPEEYEYADEVGTTIAKDVYEVLDEIETSASATIQVIETQLDLPPARLSRYFPWFVMWTPPYMNQSVPSFPNDLNLPTDPQDIIPISSIIQSTGLPIDSELSVAENILQTLGLSSDLLCQPYTAIQTIMINGQTISTLPGEAIVEIGLQIKDAARKLGVEHPFVFGLANDDISYMTTAYEYEVGGYEAGACFFGNCAGEYFMTNCITGIQQITGNLE